jgi:hypothetical protein
MAFSKVLLAASALSLAVVYPFTPQRETRIDQPPAHQIATDGDLVFVLKDDGTVWSRGSAGWQRIDEGGGVRQVAVADGMVHALKEDGSVWRRCGGTWNVVGRGHTRQIAAAGPWLFVLYRDGIAVLDGTRWTTLDDNPGTRQIAADSLRNLYALKENGHIFQHVAGRRWTMIDDGAHTRQIEASGGLLHALKESGQIWRHDGSGSQIEDGDGTAAGAADGGDLYALKSDGAVWRRGDSGWSRVTSDATTTHIAACAGQLVLLKEDGTLVAGRWR